MTVKELIEYLHTFPDDMPVFTKSDEFGCLYPLKSKYIYQTEVYYNPNLTFPYSHWYELDEDLNEEPGEYKEKFCGLVIR